MMMSYIYHEEFDHGCHLGSHNPGVIGSLGILSLHTFLPLHSDAVRILPLQHDLDTATCIHSTEGLRITSYS